MKRIQQNRRYAKTINLSIKQFLYFNYWYTLFPNRFIFRFKHLKRIITVLKYQFLFHTIKYAHDVLFYKQNRQLSFYEQCRFCSGITILDNN